MYVRDNEVEDDDEVDEDDEDGGEEGDPVNECEEEVT